MSANNEIRLSQLIQTFGPGALVDLPEKSVMIRGLSGWPLKSGNREMRQIQEPRLVHYLMRLLANGENGVSWLADDTTLELYEPPLKDNSSANYGKSEVPAVIYPRWMAVDDLNADWSTRNGHAIQKLERYVGGDTARPRKGVVKTPIRWVAACKNGHIDDIDWRWFTHRGQRGCQQDMFLEDEGSGSDPQFITLRCDCGARRALSELYTGATALGRCNGHRPWVEGYECVPCGEPLQPMTRGAVNNYYSQILKLIALDQKGGEVEDRVQDFLGRFDKVTSQDQIRNPIDYGDKAIEQALSKYSSDVLWAALQNIRDKAIGTDTSLAENPKVAEFDQFASGAPEIGSNELNSRLFGETLGRDKWEDSNVFDTQFVSAAVKIHRLCEVTCLYGFTRIEPAKSPFDDSFEDIRLEVTGQSLDDKVSWLPAMEQFGEGIFLNLDAAILRHKTRGKTATDALNAIEARYKIWYEQDPYNRNQFPGREYIIVHSLSHLLIEQISLEAGYPSTSLNERIYTLSQEGAKRIDKLGILIYAAGGGSQGTLGGLVDQISKIPTFLKQGIERLKICSNDPICSSHSESLTNQDELINGAACHGCLFTAETSCERRNMLLDRKALLEMLTSS